MVVGDEYTSCCGIARFISANDDGREPRVCDEQTRHDPYSPSLWFRFTTVVLVSREIQYALSNVAQYTQHMRRSYGLHSGQKYDLPQDSTFERSLSRQAWPQLNLHHATADNSCIKLRLGCLISALGLVPPGGTRFWLRCDE